MSRAPVRNPGRSWLAGLAMALSGLAQAGEGLCSGGQCGATGISATLLRKAARGSAADTAITPQPARPLQQAGQDGTKTWERRFGSAQEREEYDCALSFGVGANLGGDGFVATRLLGRTRVWRDKGAR